MSSPSLTAAVRVEQSKRNEDLVLAENAHVGGRVVTALRIIALVAMAVTVTLGERIVGARDEPDLIRGVIIGAYFAWCLFAFASTRLGKPSVRAATVFPMVAVTIDATFPVLMSWRDLYERSGVFPEKVAVVNALFLCFSVVAFRGFSVVYAGVLAIASYLISVQLGPGVLHHPLALLSTAVLTCLAALVYWTSWRTRSMFLNLRKRDNLSRMLPSAVVEQVLAGGAGADRLAPVQREVTVLFSDIADFTTLAEKLPPRSVLELLDEYFAHMTQIVKGRDGLVNKFIGDGMLAFWGVPTEDSEHAEKAVRAALDMRTKMAELNAARVQLGLEPMHIRVGVHSGLVAAGMLGGAEQHEYTVIGDAVNVASRVEGLNKQFGTDVLVTAATWKRLATKFVGRRVGEEKVKGRSEAVEVFAVDGLA